jgi:hypothetical protein
MHWRPDLRRTRHNSRLRFDGSGARLRIDPDVRLKLGCDKVYSLGERAMAELARSVGTTACHFIDEVSRSVCVTNDDVTIVGIAAVALAGISIVMVAVFRVDRMV